MDPRAAEPSVDPFGVEGHPFHVTGAPTRAAVRDHLVSVPDGALAHSHGIRADDAREAAGQLPFALLLAVREPAVEAVLVRGQRVAS